MIKRVHRISDARAQQIIDAYGASPTSWPESERDAVLDCIKHSPHLQELQQTASQLDRALQLNVAAVADNTQDRLAQRILSQLPRQVKTAKATKIVDGLLNRYERLHEWLRAPVVATALAGLLLLSVGIFINNQPPERISDLAAQQAFERWAWEDITAQPLISSDQELNWFELISFEMDGT